MKAYTCRPVDVDIEKHETQEDERKSANVDIEKRKIFINLSTYIQALNQNLWLAIRSSIKGLGTS